MMEKTNLKMVEPHFYQIKVVGKVLEWKVGNHYQVLKKLEEVQKGDIFEIMGIGRLRVDGVLIVQKKDIFIKRYLVRGIQ